jgi:hypothetical protein
VVDSLALAVLIFHHHQLVYANAAAQQLRERLRSKYRSELTVLLSDYLKSLGEKLDTVTTISLLTGKGGEVYHYHLGGIVTGSYGPYSPLIAAAEAESPSAIRAAQMQIGCC